MRTVAIWTASFVFITILILLACARPRPEPPSAASREAIRGELERIRPLLSAREFEVSGDSLLFSGLLASALRGSDREYFCDVIRRSQFEDGSFARSPAYRDRGERDFSRDQGLGILLAIQEGCIPVEPFIRFLNEGGHPTGCLSSKCDAKAKAGGTYLRLVELVARSWVRGASSFGGASAGIGIGAWMNTDYSLHLDSVTVYILDRNNIPTLTPPGVESTKAALRMRQPNNPWFRYITGDRQLSADQLLPLLRGFDLAKVHEDWLEWMWQRPTNQWGTTTFAQGWDLIFLGNLLLLVEEGGGDVL
jgi:hypothetical protein